MCLVTAGLLVNFYLAILARVLSEAEYGRFVSFVSLILLISFGGFLPIEQEMARQIQTGQAGRVVLRSGLAVGAGVAMVAAILVLGLVPWLMPSLDDGPTMIALLSLCAVCIAQFVVRGTLIGTGRLPQHGLILLWDAVLRLSLAAIVVATVSRPTAGPFALALVGAIAVAHLPVLAWARRLAQRAPGGPETARLSLLQTARRVGHLITGSISAQILLNAPPIVVAAAADVSEADLVGRFAATFTLARLVLFIAVPLQSALVPAFTRVAGAGSQRARRVLTARIGLGTWIVALLAGALSWWAGPWAIEIVFGSRYALQGRDVACMVTGAMFYLGLLVAGQALVGANRHRPVGVAWSSALLVAVVLVAVIPGLVLRVELGFAIGAATGLCLALAFLWRPQTGPVPSAGATLTPKGSHP
ncbi:MAG: hypothetical protein H0T54_08645 [Geodermatophilaceae bacterium]|nr:hypothetical protein [Geodermatophilaceae bacterium]